MELSDKIVELIAVGASITANCQPCLQKHGDQALRCGATPAEVAAAIEVGNRVRKGSTAKMASYSSAFQPDAARETK
jgi:AhpD family alkylhydroperoxidase